MVTAVSLREQILRHSSFPALPAAAVHILRLTEGRTVGLDELTDLIAADGALAAAVIHAINSSFYGLRRKVTTVRQAVALLGLQTVQTLVLGLSLAAAVPVHANFNVDLPAFWKRCVYSAAAARVLAARFLSGSVEDCFIAALVMDLGTLVLDRNLGERYGNISRKAHTHGELVLLENSVLDTNHAEVGSMLVRHWRLPGALEIPVGAHHSPQTVENPLLRSIAEILELSGRCAEVFTTVDSASAIVAAREGFATRYAMASAEADKLLIRVGQKAAELAPLLRVTLETSDYQALVEKATPRLLELALGRRQAMSANQRKTKRLSREGTLALFPCARGVLGRELRVRLRNLSAGGIGIIHGKPMPRGSQFVISLPQPGGSTKSLLYTAVRCDPIGNDFQIGAELRAVLHIGDGQTAREEYAECVSCGAD